MHDAPENNALRHQYNHVRHGKHCHGSITGFPSDSFGHIPRAGACAIIATLLVFLSLTPAQAATTPLRITSVSPVNGSVVVRWEGGTGPFQLLCRTNINEPWRKIGSPTSAFSATNPAPAGAMCFFLVTTDVTAPPMPTGLRATTNSCSQLQLTWNSGSDNPGGSGLRGYQLYRNGVFQRLVPAGTNATVESGLSPSTTYSYTLSAVDWAGNQSASTAPLAAGTPACPNIPPIADSTPPSASTIVGSMVPFDASASQDMDGSIVTYNWNFGDGATASGRTVAHSFNAAGTYFVRLTVTDNMGANSSDTTLVSVAAAAPPGQLVSVSALGGAGSDAGQAVTVDRTGNVFVGGKYGSTPYLAKRSSSGTTLWTRNFGPGTGTIMALATDSGGNVYATGNFYAGEDFGGVTVISAGGYDIFVAKFSSDGSCLWAKRFGSSRLDDYPTESGFGIAVDPVSDEVVVTGVFDSTVNFGGANLVSTCGQDMFLVRFSPTGAHLWSKRVGGSDFTVGNGVAMDSAGNIFVTGSMRSTVDFGRGAVTNGGLCDMFIARYSPAGNNVWSKNFGSRTPVATTSIGASIGVNGTNLVVTGTIQSSVRLGGNTLTNMGGQDIFVASYSTVDGSHRWSKGFGGTAPDMGVGVAVDGSDNIRVTGRMGSALNFGGGALTLYPGALNGFLANFSADGAHRWSKSFGLGFGDSKGVAVNTSGEAFVTGSFSATANFGTSTVPSVGSWDCFLAVFAP